MLFQDCVPTLTACTRCLDVGEHGGPHTGFTVANATGRPPSLLTTNRILRFLIA